MHVILNIQGMWTTNHNSEKNDSSRGFYLSVFLCDTDSMWGSKDNLCIRTIGYVRSIICQSLSFLVQWIIPGKCYALFWEHNSYNALWRNKMKLQSTRINVKTGFIAYMNFIASYQPQAPKEISFLSKNTSQ